jgi:hypothetical protein
MKKTMGIISLALLLYACSGNKEAVLNKIEYKETIPFTLLKDFIYNEGAIKQAVESASDIQKAESRKLFLKGLDLLLNKQQAAASIEFFETSILFYPDAKNYYYLTLAHIKNNNPDLADSANTVLYQLSYEPYYESVFNSALISALKKDTSMTLALLDESIMMGFLNKDKIENESLFDFVRESAGFQSLMVSTFNDEGKLRQKLFNSFVNYFPDLKLPYEIGLDSTQVFNFHQYINYDYAPFIPGMDEGRFSRDVTNEYQYVGKLKMDFGYAFIYKSFLAIADTLNPVKTFIATYDTLGNMIQNEMISCFCSPITRISLNVENEFTFNTIEYNIKWENDPLEKGYAGNKMIGAIEDKRNQLTIDKNGYMKWNEITLNSKSSINEKGG